MITVDVYYSSLTGNVKRFVESTPFPTYPMETSISPSSSFVFVTYTFGYGEVPKQVEKWLQTHYSYLKGVASSGDRVWGSNYGKAGDLLSKKYGVPLLVTFEKSGTAKDVQLFIEGVQSCPILN